MTRQRYVPVLKRSSISLQGTTSETFSTWQVDLCVEIYHGVRQTDEARLLTLVWQAVMSEGEVIELSIVHNEIFFYIVCNSDCLTLRRRCVSLGVCPHQSQVHQ